MYEAGGKEDHLTFAAELQERQDELFWDGENGGYFSSPADDPHLIVSDLDLSPFHLPQSIAGRLPYLIDLVPQLNERLSGRGRACGFVGLGLKPLPPLPHPGRQDRRIPHKGEEDRPV